MMDAELAPPRSRSLVSEVAASIRGAIFSGQLRPGAALPEVHLARKLQVSQGTVREALMQLQQAGLAVREPNKRSVVTSFSKVELAERIEIRILLETLAAVKSSARMGESELREAESLASAIADRGAGNAYLEASDLDLRFHRYLWRASGSQTLYETLDRLTSPLFAYLNIVRSGQPQGLRNVAPARSHQPIVDALRSRDETLIRRAMCEHVETWYAALLGSNE